MWKLYEIQILVSINKILLEHNHSCSFTHYLAAFTLQDILHIALSIIVAYMYHLKQEKTKTIFLHVLYNPPFIAFI